MRMIEVGSCDKPKLKDESYVLSANEMRLIYCNRSIEEEACDSQCYKCLYAVKNLNAFRNHYKWNRSE